jgi:hypothetical protein
MKVSELIEHLKEFGMDTEVVVYDDEYASYHIPQPQWVEDDDIGVENEYRVEKYKVNKAVML